MHVDFGCYKIAEVLLNLQCLLLPHVVRQNFEGLVDTAVHISKSARFFYRRGSILKLVNRSKAAYRSESIERLPLTVEQGLKQAEHRERGDLERGEAKGMGRVSNLDYSPDVTDASCNTVRACRQL